MSLTLSATARGVAPSATLKLNAAVAQMKSEGVPVLSLGAGEPDFDTPEHIRQAAIEALNTGKTRYTDVSGIPQLRQAIADHILAQKGLRYDARQIIVGAGAKQVLYHALQAILNPGDEVVLPSPYWVSYTEMIRMAGGVPVFVNTDPANFFLPTPQHPIALGADLCCDSAHKTLPVLTGGAYLHLNNGAPALLKQNARTALGLFGSSSPSYLILQSLDAANKYLATFSAGLAAFLPKVQALKNALRQFGYRLMGQEPLKLTLLAGSVGYSGPQLAGLLKQNGIYPEFYDKDLLVLMLTPQNRAGELKKLQRVLCSVTKMKAVKTNFPRLSPLPASLSPRQALLCESEVLALEQCLGRVCAAAALSCPPAVPVAVCGEVLTKEALSCLAYYGIKQCAVVKNSGGQTGF